MRMTESVNSDIYIPNALTIWFFDSLKKGLLVNANIEVSTHSLDYSYLSYTTLDDPVVRELGIK